MTKIFVMGNKKFNLILKVCILALAINSTLLISNKVFAACPYGPGIGSCALGTCDGVCCGTSCCEGACAVPTTTTTTIATTTTTVRPTTTTTSAGCAPTCGDRNCGGDGCGGSCGSCGTGGTCYYGYCVYPCSPSCAGKACGADDGCAGTCQTGSCPSGQTCNLGTCTSNCIPSCAGKACGASDGCTGTCVTGSCQTGYTCNNGTCECSPSCTGKACGAPDGCNGTCQSGSCPSGQTCFSGVCSATASHKECLVGQCISVDGAGSNTCTINSDCSTSTYKACSNGQCTSIRGIGTDRCSTNADCAGFHGECQNNTCVRVSGAGLDKCINNSDCWVQTHKGCLNGQCETLIGVGADTCNGYPDCQIAPTEHTVCNVFGTCTKVSGAGTNECANPGNSCGTSTYKACVTGQCISINGIGTDRCTGNTSCVNTHNECQDNQCISVSGSGISTCVNNSDCWIQKHKICSYYSGIGTYGCIEVQGLGDNECDTPANCAPTSKYSCVSQNCVVDNNGPYSSLSACTAECQVSPSPCQNGETQNCTVNNCPGTKICSNGFWGECSDNVGDGCPAPVNCTYTVCECLGGNCSTVTKTGTTPCPPNQSCISCPAYNTCSSTGTCSVSQPESTIMSGSCPSSGCTSDAQCPSGDTNDCNWTVCSTTGLCNVPKSSIIPINQTCPIGCSFDSECNVPVSSAIVVISGSCQNGSAPVTSQASGGNLPYKKYTWYEDGLIDYEQTCSLGSGCITSHTYNNLGTSRHQVYLRIEDAKGVPWASNILSLDCSATVHKYKCDSSNNCVQDDANGRYTTSNCDNSCSVLPPPPLPTGCLIDGFDITPSSRITLLGFNFTASWNAADCTDCTLSCGPNGCGIAGELSGLSTSGTSKITPTKVGSTYSYTLDCESTVTHTSDSKTLGAGVTDNKFFKVINPFWRETPAFLKLLVDKLFQR